MTVFSNEQRRARLAQRHALTPATRASGMEEAARAVVAIHATDPATVYMSTWARVDDVALGEISTSLYEDRSVVRVMGMRRTLFVVPADLVPLVAVGAAADLAARERRRLEKMLPEAGLTADPQVWLPVVEEATLAALALRGEALSVELAEDVPELALKLLFGAGTKWAGEIALSSRVLFLLSTEGRIIRGRPRGTWVSSQYRWVLSDQWLPEVGPPPSAEEARAGLVKLYLGRFGPVTETDVAWWTGWTKTATRAALAAVGAVEVALEGGVGLVLADDLDPVADPQAWVALLPALDSTIMGWKERDWYLGPHAPILFDRNGNAGPSVWVDGRVVGGWAQSPDGEVVYRLLEKVGSDAVDAVDERASQLSLWLDGKVVMPRFPSPLQRQLAG